MKKTTSILLLCILLSSINAFALKGKKNDTPPQNIFQPLKTKYVNQTMSTSFYSEDFGSGLPAGWQLTNTGAAGINWKYTIVGTEDGTSLDTTGTTASNGYLLYDSDSAGNSNNGENADAVSVLIDCSSRSTVILDFNEYLRHYIDSNEVASVLVSNDSVNWTIVYQSSDGLPDFGGTTNPNHVTVDISSVAANQDTVYLRWNYFGDYAYYWMIDDIQLSELPSIDGALDNILTPVTNCTLLGATDSVKVNIHNAGALDINGTASVTMMLDGGSPVTENVTDTITIGSDYVYTFAGTVDLSTPGYHTLVAYITVPADGNETNDTIQSSIFSGTHLVDHTNGYTNGFEPTDDYSGFITEDVNADSITWNVDSTFSYGGTYSIGFMCDTANDWFFTTCLELDSSIVYRLKYWYKTALTSTQAMMELLIGDVQASGGMNQVIHSSSLVSNVTWNQETDVFTPSVPGTYYIGFHVSKADSIVGLYIDDIDLKADSTVGIKNIGTNGSSIFPNPSTGVVFLNAKENSSKGFKVEIYNPVGQLTMTKEIPQLSNYKMDLSNEPAGIYTIRIVSDKGTDVERVIIK